MSVPDLGDWERLNNPGFNSLEFDGIRNEAVFDIAAVAALHRLRIFLYRVSYYNARVLSRLWRVGWSSTFSVLDFSLLRA